MSTTEYNGYVAKEELTTKNSGFSKWGFAHKNGKDYFIKEFLSPVYPEDVTMFTEKQLKSKQDGCLKFEKEKRELYQKINEASEGNAVRIIDFFRYGSKYYVVTDKVLPMRFQPKNIANLPYVQRKFLCKVLAHSILCLHENGVVHADIKWDNVLFAQSSGGKRIVPKLIDFDNSFLMTGPPEESEDLNLDLVYCAPEAYLFLDEEDVTLTEKIDIYALGLIFHQIMTGTLPQIDKNYEYVFRAQLENSPIILSKELENDMATLIRGMLKKEPEERMNAREVWQEFNPKAAETRKEEIPVAEAVDVAEEKRIKETPQPAKYGKYFTPAGDL